MVVTELFINMDVFIFKKKKKWKCIAKTTDEVSVRRAGAPMGATSAARPRGCAVTPDVLLKTLMLAIFCSTPQPPRLLTHPRLGCPSAAGGWWAPCKPAVG